MRHIDYVCFLNRSGYAQAALDYIYALKSDPNYNVHITLLHTSPDQLAITPKRYREVMGLMNNPLDDNRFVQIFHCIPDMQRRADRGGKRVGVATFETSNPPKEWIEILNSNDAVICVSRFNEQVFKEAGIKIPIFYVPHAIDTTLFHPNVEPINKTKDFTFMFFGTWRHRKGWRELLEAWFREFKRSDNVRLVIKTDRMTIPKRDIEEMRKNLGLSEKETAPIFIETKILTEVELPRFLKNADCLVCPTYGEGFGLPGLQCMAMGVPVIITDYSGCREYATDETATLIKPSGLILYNEMDNIPQFRNKKWAHITVDAVRQSMRYVRDNTDIVKQKAQNAVSVVADKFNYKAVLNGFNTLVESLE